MKKLLITGGTGFIGKNLAEAYAGEYDVTALGSAALNLCAEETVRDYLRAGRFDVVIHAATTRSNRRLGAPADLLERNCRMFFNLARNQDLYGKMLYFGSGAEYGRFSLPPRVREEDFDRAVPRDTLGFSKYICAKYTERAGNIFNLRVFGVFGRYEDWTVRFISNACARAAHGLPIVVRQDVRFDYLYMDDLTRLTRWFIEGQPRQKIYNVCHRRTYTLKELAEIVAAVSGRQPEIVVRNPGMGHEYSGDNTRLMEEMGGFQFREMEAAIAELYAWYAARRQEMDPAQLRFDE